MHPDWSDEASVRAFITSDSYKSYLKSLDLDDKYTGVRGPAMVIAELIRGFFPISGVGTIYTFSFAHPIPPETPINLRGLTPHVPYDVYYPGRCGGARPKYGWIIDPQLVEGRLVKKGMTLETWAPIQSAEKQLEVYQTMREQHGEEWRLKVEALHPLHVDEATWDFTELEDPLTESEPESEPEASLETKLGQINLQK